MRVGLAQGFEDVTGEGGGTGVMAGVGWSICVGGRGVLVGTGATVAVAAGTGEGGGVGGSGVEAGTGAEVAGPVG